MTNFFIPHCSKEF